MEQVRLKKQQTALTSAIIKNHWEKFRFVSYS